MVRSRTAAAFAVALAIGLSAPVAQAADPIRMAFIDPLSGPFAATGTNGLKEFEFYAGLINEAGGVLGRKIEIVPFDNKATPAESLIQLKRVLGEKIQFVFQGNSSGVAHALTEAIAKNNERNPDERILYLNYSAVDPALTNEACNFWHFRFDANSDMKMAAITDAIAADTKIKKIYLLGQDYSFGKAVASAAREMLAKKRPDIQIVGDELHPIGKVKDFSPYIAKVKAAGADALITGNWGADMLGLAKAAEDASLDIPIYTYYGAGTGITKAIGKGGVGKVRLVHESVVNPVGTEEWRKMNQSFKKLNPDYDILQARIGNALGMTVKAIEKAGSTDPLKVAKALSGMEYTTPWGDKVMMRAEDHQLQLPIRISVHTDQNVEFDYDNSGFGLVTETLVSAEKASVPARGCKMKRPD